ncbi:Ethylene-responsive binding factor-associated repression [Arabidopsis suecica]|uniref:Ninja-family protein n=1 Tax=Arabidopsis suecica TaxID=45249 RepID=A0A8T2B3Q1_ARASU|nr:Ethylene-responsive binding factor-associated repression [Arabidopsis suecica]
MATKYGEDENVEVELELCLSLGGPFKKTEKSKPIGRQSDAVGCAKGTGVNLEDKMTNVTRIKETRKKREAKQQQRSGEEEECKRIRTECNGVTNGEDMDLSFSKMGNGYGSGQLKENSKDVTIGSPICTSSDVSDPSSSSRHEGGSCDLGAQSGQTKPVGPPVNNIQTGTEQTVHSTDGSKDAVVVETQALSNTVTKKTGKPPKPHTNSNGNGRLLPFAQMPCVTSTGNGPEGKTVNGFLYRYSKSEISIICVCHGTSFSPAEFIVHAGGTNVSHPLRHITVVPSTL